MPPAVVEGTGPPFDVSQAWMLNPCVAVRPEPFGALLYHFGTRRLSFLKDRRLLDIVRSLSEHPDARSACRAHAVSEGEIGQFSAALARLAASDMLVPCPPEETS